MITSTVFSSRAVSKVTLNLSSLHQLVYEHTTITQLPYTVPHGQTQIVVPHLLLDALPTTTLTCLEDLIAQGEACTLPGVVGGELDVENGARGDDGGWSDVPTVLSQEVCRFAVSISNLDEVIPR